MKRNPEELKSKIGGKREGAGRPKGSITVAPEMRRLRISCRLPKYVIDWLRSQKLSMGTLIEIALEAYKIPHPKQKPK